MIFNAHRVMRMGAKRAAKMVVYRARAKAKKEGAPMPDLPPSKVRLLRGRGYFYGRGQHS